MAVDKDTSLTSYSDNLILKKPRKHYNAPVRSHHWQLRSLISAENQHIVYLPGGANNNHIQRLNTKTQECETIKLLSFVPRCLVAQNGWVCCGGEYGDFSAIRLGDNDASADLDTSSINADSETRLSLDLDPSVGPEASLLATLTRQSHNRRSNKMLIAKSIPVAQQRVNCITLWFPPTDGCVTSQGAYTEPVAVLANNDKTVTIVSLLDFETNEQVDPIDIIKYPDFVNRAIISPDGSMLVAILDDPYLYVHQRDKNTGSRGFSWAQKTRWLLKSQRREDTSDHRGSFAACFSSAGTTLAVGTQYGTISIFDTSRLAHIYSDPLIASFCSSRPDSPPGAIRDMAFCPGNNDLLAWTEDRGRIGIVDARSNYIVRQILDITEKNDFERMSVIDRNTIDPHLLGSRSDSDPEGAAPDATRRHRETDGPEQAMAQGLTNTELMLLEGLQMERRRTSGRSTLNAVDAWRVLSPHDPDRQARRGAATNDDSNNSLRRNNQRSNSLSRALETLNELRQRMRHDLMPPNMSQFRIGLEDGSATDERTRVLDPRDAAARRLMAAVRRQYMPSPNITAPARLYPRLTVSSGRSGADGGLEMSLDGPSMPDLLGEESEGARRSHQRDSDRERDRDTRLPLLSRLANRDNHRDWIRDWEPMVLLQNEQEIHDVPPMEDNTSGLAWSRDGRVLFIGAQNGVYEFRVNTLDRKFHPAMTLR